MSIQKTIRPLTDEERQQVHQWHKNQVGSLKDHLEGGGTVIGVFGAFLAGMVPFAITKQMPWAIVPPIAGGAVGFFFDFRKAKRSFTAKRQEAGEKWLPWIEKNEVEVFTVTASAAVRIDDSQGDTAWFLQVEPDKILCTWSWQDDATTEVELRKFPDSEIAIGEDWRGDPLPALRSKRKFKRGEKQPKECEIIQGTLDQLDELLKKPKGKRRKPTKRKTKPGAVEAFEHLRDLGLFKYLDELPLADELGSDLRDWLEKAERAFDGDAERLAEGGVADVLDYMRPALSNEGVTLGQVTQQYDEHNGYVIEVDGERTELWGPSEGNKSWELTVKRTCALVNQRLESSGSSERLHLLDGGEDGTLVLLTSEITTAIAAEKLFNKQPLPALL